MKKIDKATYEKANKRMEILLNRVDDSTPTNHPDYIELNEVSNIIEVYETEHYKLESPTLLETIKYVMFEKGLNNKDLAEVLEISPSRISEYLNGKREITFDVAKKLYRKLHIDPEIILQ